MEVFLIAQYLPDENNATRCGFSIPVCVKTLYVVTQVEKL